MEMKFSDFLSHGDLEPQGEFPIAPEVKERIRYRTMKQLDKGENSSSKRGRRFGLKPFAVAAVAAAMCVAAGAAAVFHAGTLDLFRSENVSGVPGPVEITDRQAEAIHTLEQSVGVTSQDNGTSVTLNSVLGCALEERSIICAVLTIVPQEALNVPQEDASSLSFFDINLLKEDGERVGFNGGTTTLLNDDGTCSLMLRMVTGENLDGQNLTLEFEDFGINTKETIGAYLDGTAQPEVSGSWSVTFPLKLESAREIEIPEGRLLLSTLGAQLIRANYHYGMLRVEMTDGSSFEVAPGPVGADEDNVFDAVFLFDAPVALGDVAVLDVDEIRVPVE